MAPPKRPPNSFMIWMQENRENIRKDNPDVKYQTIGKIGGKMWNALEDKSVSNHFL